MKANQHKLVPSFFDRLMDEDTVTRHLEARLEKSWPLAEMLEAIWRELALTLEIKREQIDFKLRVREAAQRLERETRIAPITAANFGDAKVQTLLARMLETLVRKAAPQAWEVKTSLHTHEQNVLLFTARIAMQKTWSEKDIKEKVRRDIENLLNTRAAGNGQAPDESEARKHSLHTYGLPDLSSLGFQTEKERVELEEIFAQALRAFEPRLERVKVTVGERDAHNHTLKLAITGVLKMNQMEERVIFNTVFAPQNGVCEVKEAASC